MARPGYSYTGDLLNMVREGHGKASFGNGFEYVGQFSRGKRHGTGVFRVVDGSTIEGDCFDRGQLTGFCTRTWPDGSVYYGELFQGHYHGKGFLLQLQRKLCLSGTWNLGQAHGKCVLVKSIPCGYLVYNGDFENHKRTGYGTVLIYRNISGIIDHHDFNIFLDYKDDMDAILKLISKNCELHESYEGQLDDGKRHGSGILKSRDRTQYEGTWENDLTHGQGYLFRGSEVSNVARIDDEDSEVLEFDFPEEIAKYLHETRSGKILNVEPLEDIQKELKAKSASAGPKDFQSYLLSAANAHSQEVEEEDDKVIPLEYPPAYLLVLHYFTWAKKHLRITWPNSISYFGNWENGRIKYSVTRAIPSSSVWNRPVCPNQYPIDFTPMFVDPNAQEIVNSGKKGSSGTLRRSASRPSNKPSATKSSKKDKEAAQTPTEKLFRSKAITVYPGCKLPLLNVFCLTNISPELQEHAKMEDAKQIEEFHRNREADLQQLKMLEMQLKKKSMRSLSSARLTKPKELTSTTSKANLRTGGGSSSFADDQGQKSQSGGQELVYPPQILPQLYAWEAWFQGESGRLFMLSLMREDSEETSAFSKSAIEAREDQEKKKNKEEEDLRKAQMAALQKDKPASAKRSSSASTKHSSQAGPKNSSKQPSRAPSAKGDAEKDVTAEEEKEVVPAPEPEEPKVLRDDMPLLNGEVYDAYLREHKRLLDEFEESEQEHKHQQAMLFAAHNNMSLPGLSPTGFPGSSDLTAGDVTASKRMTNASTRSMQPESSSRNLRAGSTSANKSGRSQSKNSKEQAREEAEMAARLFREQVLQSLPKEPLPPSTESPYAPPVVDEAILASRNMLLTGDVRNANYVHPTTLLQPPQLSKDSEIERPDSSSSAKTPLSAADSESGLPAAPIEPPPSKFLFYYKPEDESTNQGTLAPAPIPRQTSILERRPHLFMPIRQDSVSSLCPEDLEVIGEISEEQLVDDFDLLGGSLEFLSQQERKAKATVDKIAPSPVAQLSGFRKTVLEKINSPSIFARTSGPSELTTTEPLDLPPSISAAASASGISSPNAHPAFAQKPPLASGKSAVPTAAFASLNSNENSEPEAPPPVPETRDVFGTFFSSSVGGQAVFENIVVPPNVPFGQYVLRIQDVTPQEYFPAQYPTTLLPDIELEMDILPKEAFYYSPPDSNELDI